MSVFGLPPSTSLALLVVAASLAISVAWALNERRKER
jgi:hypothetical protein